jgi:4-amino-4-deoxy-L-arabinose transferase-like glycosyltransferase
VKTWLLRHPRLLIVAIAALFLGSALGQRDPWHIDEVRFVGVALEMLQSGQWWVPHRAGEIYADKPPIFFWVLGALFKLTDSVRWTFLLPAVLAGIATLLMVYDLAARLWNRRIGLCAAITLLTCYQFWRLETSANIDGFLLAWTTLGLYGFARYLLLGRERMWFFTAIAAVAIGILSKGVGFLPLLIFIPYAVLRRRDARFVAVPIGQWAWGTALLLILLLCWLVPLLIPAQTDVEIKNYLDEILFHQTANRYTKAWQHREPVWFFLQEIPKSWAPLSIFLPWIVPLWWRRLRRFDARYVLLVGWAGLVLIFFSLSSGKRELYILPALPAVAIVAAPALLMLLRQRIWQRVINVAAVLLIAATSATGIIRLRNLLPKSPLAEWPQSTGIVLLVAALTSLSIFILLRRQHAALRWLAVYAVTIMFYLHGLIPLTDAKESGHAAMTELSQAAPTGLALIDWDERNWLFARTPITHNGIGSKLERDLCSIAPEEMHWLIPVKLAEQAGLATDAAIAVQPKDKYIVADAAPASDCSNHTDTDFRYRFQWSEASLHRLQR